MKKDKLVEMMKKDNEVLVGVILHIYDNQTQDEKGSKHTSHQNGIGFNSTDAEFGSSIAKQVINGRSLSPAQLDGKTGTGGVRKMMIKYAQQALDTGFTWGTIPNTSKLEEFDRATSDLLGEDTSGTDILEIVRRAIEGEECREYIGKMTDMSDEYLSALYDDLNTILNKE